MIMKKNKNEQDWEEERHLLNEKRIRKKQEHE